ncbi:IPTL-CTERM sorting domain-containing protein [Ottowia thiooxydans]|uniref:IPTL-CTERM protein sorting domain-containing protein n=1 Tax=Ottowia thiooxydans TaxID=219182 RepID=A0ABV2Q557_9BURK
MTRFRWLIAAMAAWSLATVTIPASAAVPPAERAVLEEIYNSTGGASWSNNANWLTGDPCEDAWAGVICIGGPEHHVSELHLSNNALSGTLPGFTALASLQRVNVSYNNLTGPMPDLAGLTALVGFWANDNQFSGFLPELSGLTSLEFFYASANQLVGPIPDISGMTSLKDFRVSTNKLTGTPPPAPSGLLPGGSSLCPNYLHSPSLTDAQWSAATSELDWSRWCTPGFLATASAGAGGSIDGPAAVALLPGETASFTLTPDTNFVIDTTGGTCGGTLAGNTFTTNQVQQDCTVTVTFRPVTYQVTPSAGPGGSITPATPQTVPAGETVAFTAMPNLSYAVDTLLSTCGGSRAGNQFTAGPVTGDCTVTVTFKALPVMAVPSLGEWALLLTGLLAAGLGALRLRRRATP